MPSKPIDLCVDLSKRKCKVGGVKGIGALLPLLAWRFAGVAELVDALDLGSSGESRGGSSPSARTSLRERERVRAATP